jgi:VWFA-related protein
VTGVALTVLAVAVAGAQQEIPRFKSGVDVVQFTATVLDKDRHPITGLTASDFEVLVDGQPRPLAAFAAVTLPADPSVAAASIPPIAPDVLTNQLPPEGRLVVIVIDRSIPDGEPMRSARAVANAAIDRLGPNDLGAVVYTGAVSRKFSQGITADRARLHAAANLLSVGALREFYGLPSLAVAVATHGATQSNEVGTRVPLASEERSGECNCGVCVIDSLTALAKALTGAMGRHKSILFVGSDIAIGATDTAGRCAAFIYPARDRLTRALDAANVTFHTLDPRGLDPAEGISFRMMSLGVLPDYTGGRTVINNNQPEQKIDAIFDESRSYYVLAVARDPIVPGGADRHQITITTKRSGAVVRARATYFAADPKVGVKPAANPAAAALNELLPGGDFSLQMNLVPQFSPDGAPQVRVLLGADSAIAGKLDVVIATFDRVFTPVGTPLKQRLDVPAGAVAGSATFQWTSVLKPPPGDYEVRAAVATADGKRAASVIGYVDVPDVRKADLALSGIIVKSGGAPTLRRVFAAGESIALSFQVARAKSERSALTIRYRVADELGQSVIDGSIPATSDDAIHDHEVTLRVPGSAGRYVATIDANDGRRGVRRDVPITVR